MTELFTLQTYSQQFDEIKIKLEHYHANLYNNFFHQNENESNEKAYKRGEGIYDQFDQNINNLNEILKKENEIISFFEKC